MSHSGVPVLSPSFADMRCVTSGLDAARAGYDPIRKNPFDHWLRPMNYPRIWLFLSKTGISEKYTEIIGIFLAFCFYCCLYKLIPSINSSWEVLIYALLILSPAMILGIERGNNDLVIFILLSIAVVDFSRKKWFFYTMILFCSLIKLFPIFAFLAAFKESCKVFLRILIIFGSIFGFYILFIWKDILLLYKVTPRPDHFSFGHQVIFHNFKHLFDQGSIDFISWLSTFAVLFLAFLMAKYSRWNLQAKPNHIIPFCIGTGIYLGTFLIGRNWDYRLMFLLFCVPQLFEWSKNSDVQLKRIAWFSLICMIISFWSLFFEKNFHIAFSWKGGGVIEEALNWVLFYILFFLLLKSFFFFTLKSKQFVARILKVN